MRKAWQNDLDTQYQNNQHVPLVKSVEITGKRKEVNVPGDQRNVSLRTLRFRVGDAKSFVSVTVNAHLPRNW